MQYKWECVIILLASHIIVYGPFKQLCQPLFDMKKMTQQEESPNLNFISRKKKD